MSTMLVTLDRNIYLKRLRAYKGDEEEFRQLILNALVFDSLAGWEHERDHGTIKGHLIDTCGISRGTMSRYVRKPKLPDPPVRKVLVQKIREYVSAVQRARATVPVPDSKDPVQQELPLSRGPDETDLAPPPFTDRSPYGSGIKE